MKKLVSFLAGISTLFSVFVGAVPAHAVLPSLNLDVTLIGEPGVGGALGAQIMADDATVTYKWYAGTKVISTSSMLSPIAANLAGKTVKVVVTGKQDGYKTFTFTSSPIKIGTVNVTAKGYISGEALVGEEISYFQNTTLPYSDADGGYGISTLQWKADGVNIAGATTDTLTVTNEMRGKKLSITETVAYDGLTSNVTTTVMAKPVLATLGITNDPTVTANPIVGTTVGFVINPVWDVSPDKISYQWYRDGKPISKATAATYKLVDADWHKTIYLKITGSKAGYQTYSKYILVEDYVLKDITITMPAVSGYNLWQECETSIESDGCARSPWNPSYAHVYNSGTTYLSGALLSPETTGTLVKWKLQVSVRTIRVTVIPATAVGSTNIVDGQSTSLFGSVVSSTDWFTAAADDSGYVYAGLLFDSSGESLVRWARLTAVVRE